MLEIKDVSFRYGESESAPWTLRNIDLTVQQGELVVLCGKSACGKTTLSRVINGLVPQFYEGSMSGTVLWNGRNLSEQPLAETARSVGSVFQNPRSQFFNVDTTGELSFGCENLGMPVSEILERVDEAATAMDVKALMDRSIFELSGGEKQRVACASIYAVRPDLFVLDEPSSNLDAKGVQILREVLTKLKANGKTVVVSEHRLHYLVDLADRFVYMDQGQIQSVFTNEEMKELSPEALAQKGLRCLSFGHLSPEPVQRANSEVYLSVEELTCQHNGTPVLHIPQLELRKGDIVAVIGDNGAGKSTLAGCLCGWKKHKGKFCRNGRPCSAHRRLSESYMVMQDVNHQLFTESVLEEVMLGARDCRTEDAKAVLRRMGLDGLEETHPLALSGGQKQRVAIAGAMCSGRKVLVYDEPTSGQDYIHMQATCERIQSAAEKAELSLVITHDLEFIFSCCRSVLEVKDGQAVAYYPLDREGIERVKEYFLAGNDAKKTQRTADGSRTEKRGVEELKSMKKQKKQSGMMQSIHYAGGHKALIGIGCVLSAVSAVLGLMPYVFVWLVARDAMAVFPHLHAAPNLARWGWMAVWFAVGGAVLYFAALMCTHFAAFRTARNIRNTLMRHVVQLSLGFFVGSRSGLLRKQIDENAGLTEDMLAHKLPDFAGAVATLVAAVVVLFVFDWAMGILCLLTMGISFIAMARMMTGKNADFFHQYQLEIERMSGSAVEYVRGIPVVKVFQQTVHSFKAFYNAILSYRDLATQYSMSCQADQTMSLTAIHGAFVVLIPAALLLASRGNAQGVLVNFIFYAMFAPACGGMINRLMYATDSLRQTEEAMFKLNRILNELPLPETDAPQKPHNNSIEFREVTFTYPGMETPALKEVSIEVREGTTVALVGPSGGGKTTAAGLIPRFWDVQEGSVRIGDVDVRHIDKNVLMETVAFVFQDTKLFKKSLYDNIVISRPSATREEVLAAAHAAQCDDILEKMPNGLDTVIGTKGVYLSGGEAQRIALARAILKDAPIIVLDEATAFADPENEHQIQKAFESLTRGKTVLMIAHRLSTIRNADAIFVMEDGAVTERGTHAELLHKNGKYSAMWTDYHRAAQWKVAKEVAV